jgi:opacity protein-like surface antigen
MRSRITKTLVATAISLSLGWGAATAAAEEGSFGSGTGVSVMGGVQALNQNDTALPEGLVNVPLVGTLTYELTPVLAVEGEFTWLIPVEQDVELGSGITEKRKTPDILAYQGNLRARWPLDIAWKPYLVGGVGAMTFLSNSDANRLPQLDESQTMFAINFGAGVTYDFTSRLGLRADFREFAAFPGNDTVGLSSDGNADPIWMERGTLGAELHF